MTQDLRPVVVRNNTTGEVREFVCTRAGLYNLAKFVETERFTRFDQLKILLGNNYLANFGVQRHFMSSQASRSDLSTYQIIPNFVFLNLYRVPSMEWLHKEDTINFNGNRYPREWRQYIKRCEHCGQLYFDQESTPSHILDYIDNSHIGYEECCPDCVIGNYYNMGRCSQCGRWFDEDDMTYIEGEEQFVCEDCLSEYYLQCDNCGEWFNRDNGYEYVESTDRCYCCSDCCENDGNHWSERRDCWVPDDEEDECDNEIGDYHDSKGCLSKERTKPDKRVNQDLYIGRETELEGHDTNDFGSDYYREMREKFFKDRVVFEHDGSVDLEVISHPMSERDFFSFDWDTGFKQFISDGWRSHDAPHTGTHFHFSEGYLGFNRNERRNNAKKIVKFFQLYWNDLAKLSRRKHFDYCMPWEFTVNKNTDFYDLTNDRYHAVNLQNMEHGIHTIEIRICKGTLKTSTMLASADFFLHIVRNAKRISWKNINNLKLWFKGIRNQNTIDYIKARHAFEGAF